MATVAPEEIETELMLQSAPEVPTDPSQTVFAPLVILKNVAVPVLDAVTFEIAPNVIKALLLGFVTVFDPAAGRVKVASTVFPDKPVLAFVGCVPE